MVWGRSDIGASWIAVAATRRRSARRRAARDLRRPARGRARRRDSCSTRCAPRAAAGRDRARHRRRRRRNRARAARGRRLRAEAWTPRARTYAPRARGGGATRPLATLVQRPGDFVASPTRFSRPSGHARPSHLLLPRRGCAGEPVRGARARFYGVVYPRDTALVRFVFRSDQPGDADPARLRLPGLRASNPSRRCAGAGDRARQTFSEGSGGWQVVVYAREG